MPSRRRSLVPGAAGLSCIAAISLAAGCGGGGGSTSAVRVLTTPAGRTVTVPRLSRTTGASHGSGTTTTTPSTITLPSGATIQVGQLTPFRDCLRDHGVTPVPIGQAPRTPLPTRAEMRARLACAPKLPPPLQQLYLRVRRRFQQRLRCFRTHRNRAVCARITLGLRPRHG